jgi:hypothetical protein
VSKQSLSHARAVLALAPDLVDEVKTGELSLDAAYAQERKKAKDPQNERLACEIRLRAERKAGRLRAEMEKAKAGRPPQNRSHDTTDFRGTKTLRELGISKDQSSKWQQLADVPDEQFGGALGRGPPNSHDKHVI